MYRTQLRYDDGSILELNDMADAFDVFYSNPHCWKISFVTPKGKRMRIVKGNTPAYKESNTDVVLHMDYVENQIEQYRKEIE